MESIRPSFPHLSPPVAEALGAYAKALDALEAIRTIEVPALEMSLRQTVALGKAEVTIIRMREELEEYAKRDAALVICEHDWQPVERPESLERTAIAHHCAKCNRYTRRARL